VHTISPFVEAGLLSDPGMRDSVCEINARVMALAPVLNTQSVTNGVVVKSSDSAVPVDTMTKRFGCYTYIFSVAMRGSATNAFFSLRDFAGSGTVEVINENRAIPSVDGVFSDSFAGYATHIYRILNP